MKTKERWADFKYGFWKSRFGRWWYWLKCRTIKPYNVVKISTLGPEWNDADEKIVHAAFQILCDFMEQEDPNQINWEDSPERHAVWEEIQYLYGWWNRRIDSRELIEKNLRMKLEKTPDKGNAKFGPKNEMGCMPLLPLSPEASAIYQEWTKWEEDWNREDTDNCIRLLKLRQYLWV